LIRLACFRTPSRLAAALSLGLAFSSVAAASQTIPAVAVASGRLETLVAALKAAGLAEAVAGEGPFTVFAPTDAAFAALPEGTVARLLERGNRDTLVRILKHHVVAGRLGAADLVGRESVETLAGTTLPLASLRGRLLVGDAAVETADIGASNGVVHLVDRVLLPPPPPASPLQLLLEGAINRGAPIFNAGEPAACAAIYATALEAAVLADGFGLEADARRRLRDRLAEIDSMPDASDRAWAYRRVMDSLLSGLAHGGSPAAAAGGDRGGRTLFAFDDAAEVRAWRTILDGVMGGRSTGRIREGEGAIRFDGETSLANNGGFSSMRADVEPGRLAGFDAVRMRLKGDGRSYRFGVRTGAGQRGDNFWSTFPTVAGQWQEVVLPLAEMDRHIMGQRLPGRVDPAAVRGLELYIYDGKAGPFEIEIDSIEAIRAGA
jgi:uncharacterized surface protein with fasciclin (FAS1) repeats